MNIYKFPLSQGESHVTCKVLVNHEEKIVHILDLYGDTSVVNGIESIQPQLLRELRVDDRVEDWRWMLYGSDGHVCEFKELKFHPIHQPIGNIDVNLTMLSVCQYLYSPGVDLGNGL